MSGKRMFLQERGPRSPSENLAVNEACSRMVRDGSFEAICRVYTHRKGVILGNSQSVFDIYPERCDAHGYEVVRRPSGGSVIVVDDASTLCYSLFFGSDHFGRFDLTDIYKRITFPLAKNLGDAFTVEGTYYLRHSTEGKSYPVAGHAMRSSRGVVQFDGVVNLTHPDMHTVPELIKLRELYSVADKIVIRMDGTAYDMKGRPLDVDLSRARLVLSESDELKSMPGLRELGYSADGFIDALRQTFTTVFGKADRIDSYDFPQPELDHNREKLKKQVGKGNRICLGHCFVDLLEPEPKIQYKGGSVDE